VESEGGRFAYVLRDGVAVRTPVTLGATSVAAVEILSGLKVGDKVVISGTDTFNNAPAVSITQ
jgi:HlyD family secretion protein